MSKTVSFPTGFLSEPTPASDNWLTQSNIQAQKALSELSIPTRKTEAWKYSSQYLDLSDTLAAQPDSRDTQSHLQDFGGYRIVFVNGIFDAAESRLPADSNALEVTAFSSATAEQIELIQTRLSENIGDNSLPFATLNSARVRDGLLLSIKKNAVLDQPIQLIFDTQTESAGSIYPRIIIEAETNTEATVIEEYTGPENAQQLTNTVCQINLAPQARLTTIRLGMEAETVQHVGLTTVNCARDSHYASHCIGFGGKLRRHDLRLNLLEAGANCVLNGVYITQGKQHYDNHTLIEHVAPHCTSEETYRGIAADESHGIFNGKILIHRDAQKSLGNMSNKNLLLSSNAEIDTKPELEIYADDVKCAHGATVGQLDKEALFYLLSRGIGYQEAMSMLSLGFINELIEQVPNEQVRDLVVARLEAFLANAFASE
ncbi:component of SufBCD Fe-S cluster assembly scaffold [Oleiphilus messinensis]|uniref:Component of SufBCD Fe-S cluster assembly scaffold n=1 Tax=Oleiphilus messinensis TaxID=141451 RepID=A0A1Y0I8A1_9GAMM|nr:Fe-S cluster assembly protein SufD [Oleiphilus messinensis]ARU55715.1 component of SufBCD Fe-S cluster assembly scaffold [Oleiphilus messinensis]